MSNDIHDEAFWTNFRNYAKDRHPMLCECDVCERDDAMERAQRYESLGDRIDRLRIQYGVPLPIANGEVLLDELVMWAVDHASRVNWSDTFEKFLKKYEVRRR